MALLAKLISAARGRRGLIIGLGALGFSATAWLAVDCSARASVGRATQSARASGIPMASDEFMASPLVSTMGDAPLLPVSTVRPAAAAIRAWMQTEDAGVLRDVLPYIGDYRGPLVDEGGRWASQVVVKAAREFTSQNSAWLDKLLQNYEGVPLVSGHGANRPLALASNDEVQSYRLVMRAVSVAAYAAGCDGDTARVNELLDLLFQLSASLRRVVPTHEWPAALGADQAALGVVEDLLRLQTLPHVVWESGSSTLVAVETEYDLRKMILASLGQRIDSIRVAQHKLWRKLWNDPDAFTVIYYLIPGRAQYDVSGAIRSAVEEAEGVSLPPLEALAWYERRGRTKPSYARRYSLADELTNLGPSACATSYLRLAARCRAARVALGVCRYWSMHKRLPETLDELVPQILENVPTDPFDGLPLRYVKRQRVAWVWSVGSDKSDDGGVKPDSSERGQTAVLVFEMRMSRDAAGPANDVE